MIALPQLALLCCLAVPLFAQNPPGRPPRPEPAPVSDPVPADQKPVAKKATDPTKVLKLGERIDGSIVLFDIDGKPQKAHDLMNKVTIVNFYSTACPLQAGWDSRLAELQETFQGKSVNFLHIASNVAEIGTAPPKVEGETKPYENIRAHLKQKKLPFRVLVDHGNKVADLFDAKTTPHVFVFGPDGRLVYKGLVDDDPKNGNAAGRKNHLRDTLTRLLKSEKVEPYGTKEQGSPIQRLPVGPR